jgi:hypothetical protein
MKRAFRKTFKVQFLLEDEISMNFFFFSSFFLLTNGIERNQECLYLIDKFSWMRIYSFYKGRWFLYV